MQAKVFGDTITAGRLESELDAGSEKELSELSAVDDVPRELN